MSTQGSSQRTSHTCRGEFATKFAIPTTYNMFKTKLKRCEWQRTLHATKTSNMNFWKFPVTNGTGKKLTEIFGNSYREFPFYLYTFSPVILGISFECFSFQKFNNFQIFRKLFLDNSVTRFSKFLVEWKALKISSPAESFFIADRFQWIGRVDFSFFSSRWDLFC